MMSYETFSAWYDPLTDNVDYDSCAARIDTLLKKHKPDCRLIVDLACGTGSLSVRLSKLGYDVIGVDRSAEMLSVAMSKGDPSILWLCQSMQELDLYGTIDAVVCTLDSVNHITDEKELEKAFAKVALFLEPDGVFIFDANTVYKHRDVLASNVFVFDTDDVYCVWQNETQDSTTQITLDFFEQEDGVYYRSSESFRERAYSDEELEKMLSNCGMEIVEKFDGYTELPPTETSERTVYIVKKQKD
ncbi:MAG: methyltransferase domain-containing protein [Ruminococcaceae bacterium]|nr:methyltransferase domain-containing protein [Oscillospiraceae bacterium]